MLRQCFVRPSSFLEVMILIYTVYTYNVESNRCLYHSTMNESYLYLTIPLYQESELPVMLTTCCWLLRCAQPCQTNLDGEMLILLHSISFCDQNIKQWGLSHVFWTVQGPFYIYIYRHALSLYIYILCLTCNDLPT